MSKLIARRIPLARVAQLAGMKLDTLRSWYKRGRGTMKLHKTDIAASAGHDRLLSIHSALAVCIAAALDRLGVPLEYAAYAGNYFAHSNGGKPMRKAHGLIYLDAAKRGYGTMVAINSTGKTSIFPEGEIRRNIGDDGAVILRVNKIWECVRKEFDKAYEEREDAS